MLQSGFKQDVGCSAKCPFQLLILGHPSVSNCILICSWEKRYQFMYALHTCMAGFGEVCSLITPYCYLTCHIKCDEYKNTTEMQWLLSCWTHFFWTEKMRCPNICDSAMRNNLIYMRCINSGYYHGSRMFRVFNGWQFDCWHYYLWFVLSIRFIARDFFFLTF